MVLVRRRRERGLRAARRGHDVGEERGDDQEREEEGKQGETEGEDVLSGHLWGSCEVSERSRP